MINAMCLFFPSPEQDEQSFEPCVDDSSLWRDLSESETDDAFSTSGSRLACFCHSLQLLVRGGLDKFTSCRSALAKVSKLANIVHQSALFRAAFEEHFGQGKSVPASNDTRWNSVYRQIEAVVELDQLRLLDVLQETLHENLTMNAKELAQLQELVSLLAPFAEATDLTPGDKAITVSCVVPTILTLRRLLFEQQRSVMYHRSAVDELIKQIDSRFYDLLCQLQIAPTRPRSSKSLTFDSDVFLMAAALDPRYAFHWQIDHPGSQEDKNALRHQIIGKLLLVFKYCLCLMLLIFC